MTLTLAILSILGPLAIWALKRWMAKASDPVERKIKADEKLNKAIVQGDQDAVNIGFDDRLRRLQAHNDRDPG